MSVRASSSSGRSCSLQRRSATRFGRSRSRSRCSPAVEDAVRRLAQRGRRGQQPRHELLRLRQREHAVEVLREEAVAPQRALELVEAAQCARAEQLAVALVEAPQQRHAEALARGRQRETGAERVGEQRVHLALPHGDEDAVGVEHELLRGGPHGQLDGAPHDLGEPRVRLQPRDVGSVLPPGLDPVEELRDGALLDRLVADGRQHVRHVVHERRVRADDEHAPQLLAVGVEEPGGAVEADGGLAGAGAALDDERALGLGGDQPVLVGLDRRHDVAHPAFAAAVELLEQEVGDGGAVDGGAVERLVRDVRQPPALGAVAAPLRDALRVGRRRRVERPGRGRLPVDDERLAVVVVHPAAADVQRPGRRVERQAAEAEPALGVLERARAPLRPGLHRHRRELGRHHVAGAPERRAHLLEAHVSVVDVGLLRLELGMSHRAVRLIAGPRLTIRDQVRERTWSPNRGSQTAVEHRRIAHE